MASSILEIPLEPSPQTFLVSLANVLYQFTVTYRDALEAGWVLDIADSNSNDIVCGIPLVTGANLLAQYGYLGIPGALFMYADGLDGTMVPTFANLGTVCHLYYVTPS